MKAVRIQSQGALRTAERTQNLNIIIWPHKSYSKYREHRLLNLILVNRYVCLYFPVARLMAVEDELRGGAIPDIKPRILTDQVCACVYIFFYHPYSLNQSCPPTVCIILASHPEHSLKKSGQQSHALHLFSSFKSTRRCHSISPFASHPSRGGK